MLDELEEGDEDGEDLDHHDREMDPETRSCEHLMPCPFMIGKTG